MSKLVSYRCVVCNQCNAYDIEESIGDKHPLSTCNLCSVYMCEDCARVLPFYYTGKGLTTFSKGTPIPDNSGCLPLTICPVCATKMGYTYDELDN